MNDTTQIEMQGQHAGALVEAFCKNVGVDFRKLLDVINKQTQGTEATKEEVAEAAFIAGAVFVLSHQAANLTK